MTQPPLPEGFPWPERTRDWWAAWAGSGERYSDAEWQFLLDTALVHADLWGNWNLDRLPELRQRVAKFGASPEDKKRVGIVEPQMEGDPLDEISARRSARGVPTARKGRSAV